VGKAELIKYTKLMAVADGSGFPISVQATSASEHLGTLVEASIGISSGSVPSEGHLPPYFLY
jgi:hypothetical protein